MFILGLLAFLQTVFIPGFLLIKYLGIDLNANAGHKISGKIRQSVYGFGLSLLVNYLLVFVFTAAGIYKPVTLYMILFGEGVLLIYHWIWIYRGKYRERGYLTLDIRGCVASVKEFYTSQSLRYNLLLVLSIGVMAWYVFLFFYFMGGVFEHWDPVTGWNRFALDWANNQFPTNTWHYPQLIPANWSISYVMMQNTQVQCFAKGIMPLFPIAILLLFLDLGLREGKAVYLLGLAGYGILLGYLYDPSYIVSGYVDIAVSFFAFLSFHALQYYKRENSNRMFRATWLAIVFACAAAITKQAGLFILAVMLVWGSVSLYRDCKTLAHSPLDRASPIPGRVMGKMTGMFLLILLTMGIITASWYTLKEIQIHSGKDRSEIDMVQSVNKTSNYLKRLTQGVNQLTTRWHPKLKYAVYAGMLLIVLGLFHRQSRRVTLFIAVPYFLVWGFFFSYDTRNLAPALPFMAFSAAFGVDFLRKLLPQPGKFPAFKIPLIAVILSICLVLVVMNFTVFNQQALVRQQISKKMNMGDAELNKLLYRYHEQEGITGKIATNYLYLRYLPGLEDCYRWKPGRITVDFLEYLETPGAKEIHYLLMPRVLAHEKGVYKRFQEKLAAGQYRQVFIWRGYCFIRVRR